MVSQRGFTTPPTFNPLQFRLLSAVDGPHPLTGHLKLGLAFSPDDCSVPVEYATTCVTGFGDAKEPTGEVPWRGANPFVVYSWVDCSLVGIGYEELRRRTEAAHRNNVQTRVEEVFWTGGAYSTYPHLAYNGVQIDEQGPGDDMIVLQTAASTLVTGTVDVVEGISRLEEAMGDCYSGTPVLHMPQSVVAHLAANHLVEVKNAQLRTTNGSIIAAAPGYPGTSPAGAAPADGTAWIYATGAVKMWSSPLDFTARNAAEVLQRDVNGTVLVAEQWFALAWDCCHFAIPVSLGGVITGTARSAT